MAIGRHSGRRGSWLTIFPSTHRSRVNRKWDQARHPQSLSSLMYFLQQSSLSPLGSVTCPRSTNQENNCPNAEAYWACVLFKPEGGGRNSEIKCSLVLQVRIISTGTWATFLPKHVTLYRANWSPHSFRVCHCLTPGASSR